MNLTPSSNDYPLDKEYRARMEGKAQQAQLADIATDVEHPTKNWQLPAFSGHTWKLRVAAVFIILVVTVFIAPRTVGAQDSVLHPDTGQSDLLGEPMVAYRMGNYYFVTGDYQRAAEYFTEAIDLMPEVVFTERSEYSCLHWALMEAYLLMGDSEGAVETYRAYLEAAGSTADPIFLAYVQDLDIELDVLTKESAQ